MTQFRNSLPFQIISVNASRTSVLVRMSTTSPVYGGIFLNNAAPSSVADIVNQNLLAFPDGNGASSLTFSGLIPVMNYRIYFYSQKLRTGKLMSLEDSRRISYNVTTNCCKLVSIQSNSILRVMQNTNNLNLVKVSLSDPPLRSLNLTATVKNAIGQALFAVVLPGYVQFSSIGTSLTSSLSLTSLSTGNYSLELCIFGPDVADFAFQFGSSSSAVGFNVGKSILTLPVTVFTPGTPLPAPILSQAVMSSDGSLIQVTFDAATNRAGRDIGTLFQCIAVFSFDCASISQCKWIDDTTAVISVKSLDYCIGPGSFLQLSPTVSLKASCGLATGCEDMARWQNSSTAIVLKVQRPASPVSPSIVLSLPTKLSSCSSLLFDLTSSIGNAGRSWWNISAVVTTNPVIDATSLQSFLNQLIADGDLVTVIPANFFRSNVDYSFRVQMCNYLGQCAVTMKTVNVIPLPVPSLTIIGSSIVRMKRSDSLLLASTLQIPACNQSSLNLGLMRYNWRVQGNSTLLTTSKDSTRFLLPAFALQIGRTYSIRLNVSYVTSQLSFNIQAGVQVQVIEGDVKSVIIGNDKKTMRASELFVLDGSSSYDENTGLTVPSQSTSLQYRWSCFQLEPSLNSSCSGLFDQNLFLGSIRSSKLLLRALEGAGNKVAQLTLTVTAGSRTSTSIATITILPPLYPQISVESNAVSGKINAIQTLILKGLINLPINLVGNASWIVVSGGNAQLISFANTPVRERFAGSLEAFLVIPRNYLQAGNSYTFGLISTLESSAVLASNSISISVNLPPISGRFQVTPSIGREIFDPFRFLCDLWTDTDLPLSYQFSYLTGANNLMIIQSSSPLPYTSTSLPAGLIPNNQSIRCFADIFDNLKANTTVMRQVIVRSSVESLNLSTLVISNANPTTFVAVNDLVKGTGLASYLLNRADCSSSPNCTALNRSPCYSTKGTCGPCFSGYFATSMRDSNEICFKTIPTSFSSKQKECAANCSGHGDCFSYSLLLGNRIDICREGDLSCTVKCSCEEGYQLSANCALSDKEAEEKIRLRDYVIASMQSYVKLQDPDELAIEGLVNSINEIAQVPIELSDSSISALLSLSSHVISTATTQGYSSLYLSNFLSSVDSISSAIAERNSTSKQTGRRRLVSTDTIEELQNIPATMILSLLQNYSSILLREMVPGQTPAESSLNHFKLNVAKPKFVQNIVTKGRRRSLMEDGCTGNLSLSFPRHPWEEASGVNRTVLSLQSCPENESSLSVAAVTLTSAVYSSAAYRSDSVSLSLSDLPCGNEKNCSLVLSMASDNRGKGMLLKASENRTVSCSADDFSSHLISDCGTGKNYSVSCRGIAEDIIFHCPALSRDPICANLLNSGDSTGCSTVLSDETSIKCVCSLTDPSGTGVSSSSGGGGYSVSYVGMMGVVEQSFENTVLSAADLNAADLGRSWQALVTIGTLIVGIVISMSFSYYADRQAKNSIIAEEKMTEHAKQHSLFHRKSQIHREQKYIHNSPHSLRRADSSTNIFAIAEEALPQILSSQSIGTKTWNEIKRFHRWMGVIFYFSNDFPRILRVISLATNIIIMLFIQSLTYDLTHDDPAVCTSLTSSMKCLEPRSSYGTGTNKCRWVTNYSLKNDGTCEYIEPDNEIEIVLFVAIFSALASTPIALLVDWILHKILSAPDRVNAVVAEESLNHHSIDDEENRMTGVLVDPSASMKNKQQLQRPSVRQSFSNFLLAGRERSARGAVIHRSPFHKQVETDFDNLLRDLLEYRAHVQDKAHQKELDYLWGLNEDGTVSSVWFNGSHAHHADHSSSSSSLSPFHLIYRFLREKATNSVERLVVSKQSIAMSLRQEFHEIYSQLEKEQSTFTLLKNERLKTKKLLFLFQKDLLPGITGEILDSKNTREKSSLSPVSRRIKFLATLFLVALDGSMLFYVFLFAISQDGHRQTAWARSFAIYLVLDIVMISTLSVIFMHVLLPSLIVRDVMKIKKKLVESVYTYYESLEQQQQQQQQQSQRRRGKKIKKKQENEDQDQQKVFNAARYLFLSYRLAESHPELQVSKVILHFISPWPKQSYQHSLDMKKGYNDSKNAISRSISLILVFLLTNLLATPIAIQDMIIQLAMTVSVGYTVLIHLQLYQIYPVLVITPAIMIGLVIHFIRNAFQQQQGAGKNWKRSRSPQDKPGGGEDAEDEDDGNLDEEVDKVVPLHRSISDLVVVIGLLIALCRIV